jgi:hypothetical protein
MAQKQARERPVVQALEAEHLAARVSVGMWMTGVFKRDA